MNIRGRQTTIIKNSSLNFIGQAIPLAVGLYTMPKVINYLGASQFGILSIVWVLIGYFSLFDFGLSRTITKLVSERLNENRHEISPIFWTAIQYLAIFSVIGCLLLATISPIISDKFLSIPSELKESTYEILLILSISIPIVCLTSGFKGALEANQDFKILNLLQIPMGILNFTIPYLAIFFQLSLVKIVLLLAITRFLFFLIHAYFTFISIPEILKFHKIDKKFNGIILQMGGWLTVSNIVGPVMVYFDRFVIGHFLSVEQVTYYTAPYEIVSRLLTIPNSISRVLFPSFSALQSESENLKKVYVQNLMLVTVLMTFVISIIISFSKLGLDAWLGAEFANKSYMTLNILSLGILFNSIAWIPYTYLQSIGFAQLTAKIHLIELPIYLIVLIILTIHFGIIGTSIAWTLRTFLDMVCMLFFSRRIMK